MGAKAKETELFKIFKKKILSPTEVAEKAIAKKLVRPNNAKRYIKKNFSELVEQLQWDAYDVYLSEQKRAGVKAIKDNIRSKLKPASKPDDVIKIVGAMFDDLDRFYLSLTQSRRVRAGKAFEIILKTLFKKLNYPFMEQQIINGKVDFLMPTREYYNINAMDCIIFSAKRTLRERWRQIVTEGTRGLGFFLATIDEGISSPQLKEMLGHRIYLVVPDRIKKKNKVYSKAPNVLTFETFFLHHLDPAQKRWKAAGAIS